MSDPLCPVERAIELLESYSNAPYKELHVVLKAAHFVMSGRGEEICKGHIFRFIDTFKVKATWAQKKPTII